MMEFSEFQLILQRLAAYLEQQGISDLTFYWQGGEIFTLSPEWLLRANEACRELAEKKRLHIHNRLQSNLIGYGPRWRSVVAEMFGDDMGSSLDFPNVYRKVKGGTPEAFNQTWFRRYEEAKEAGIHVAVISVLSDASLNLGAQEFYSYYVEQIGMKSFQMNTPYPGGPATPAKLNYPLDNDRLNSFYSELFELWMREGKPKGVSISPFDQLIHYFRTRENRLSCMWAENCAHIFIGIGPQGNVSQCECFVAGYPEYIFGNILACEDLADIMNGPVRRQFLQRPVRLMEEEDCAECEFLTLCHGGCPVRAYSATGNLFAKDPNCQSTKTLCKLARNAAIELDRRESNKRASGVTNPCP